MIYNFEFLLAASLFKCVAPFTHPRSTLWLSSQLETVSLALLRICWWDRLQPRKSRDGAWSDWFCAITQSADLNFTHCIYCIWLHLWLTYICSKISTVSATVVQITAERKEISQAARQISRKSKVRLFQDEVDTAPRCCPLTVVGQKLTTVPWVRRTRGEKSHLAEFDIWCKWMTADSHSFTAGEQILEQAKLRKPGMVKCQGAAGRTRAERNEGRMLKKMPRCENRALV